MAEGRRGGIVEDGESVVMEEEGQGGGIRGVGGGGGETSI